MGVLHGGINVAKPCRFGPEWAFKTLKSQESVLQEQCDALRVESVDGVHDMRVASRRFRAGLRAFRPFLPREKRKVVKERMRKVTRLLGRPRELDVMLGMLSERDGFYPVEILAAERDAVSGQCAAALTCVEEQEFSKEVEDLFAQPYQGEKCFVKHLPKTLAGDFAALCHQYDDWLSVHDDEHLHRIRIAAKKLRYACEIHAPHYDDAMQGLIADIQAVQQLLGRWNDARVLLSELRGLSLEKEALTPIEREVQATFETFSTEATSFFTPRNRGAVRRLLLSPDLPCCCSCCPSKD
jgi:CHAD domain-containing protein